MTKPLDVRGHEIKQGDILATAFNLGRCAALGLREVLEVRPDGKLSVGPVDIDGAPTSYSKGTIQYPARSIIINKLVD